MSRARPPRLRDWPTSNYICQQRRVNRTTGCRSFRTLAVSHLVMKKTPTPMKLFFGALSLPLPYLLPSKVGSVVITSFHGRGYRGNPRILFEYLVEQGELQPMWLTTEPSIVTAIQNRYGEHRVALAHSCRGIWALARARAIVLSHGITDLPWLHLGRKALLLQSFHGLPTKRGEYMNEGLSAFERFQLWRRFHLIDVFLSSSKFVSDIYRQRFGLPAETFVELGYPSYDDLQKGGSGPDTRALFKGAPDHSKVILYAPTFRKQEATRLFPFDDLDGSAIDAMLAEQDALLALRLHPNDALELGPVLALSPRIVVADQSVLEDVQPLLKSVSLVITDYSSIYIEALLRDTPVAFIPYDLKTYERGLAFDYETYTPGPKIHTCQEFVRECRQALAHPDRNAETRKRIKEIFFSNDDGRAVERLAEFLKQRVM